MQRKDLTHYSQCAVHLCNQNLEGRCNHHFEEPFHVIQLPKTLLSLSFEFTFAEMTIAISRLFDGRSADNVCSLSLKEVMAMNLWVGEFI